MQLGRYQVSTLRPPPILSISFSQDGRLFTVASETGYEVWRTWPLALVRRRTLPGTLARAVLLPGSPLMVLQGGGKEPLYPPNKAVIFHDGLGVPVAELEFGERIRGIAVRHSTVIVALRYKVLAYRLDGLSGAAAAGTKGKGKATDGFQISKIGEWETAENEAGLVAVATSPGSSLLVMPGRQAGHVQLAALPPCPPATSNTAQPFRSPIILAHTHPLSTLACTANGSHILTTSERGTLLRVWDASRGRLERELRRGMDRAEMWGVKFEDETYEADRARKGGMVVGWSDKGTVHVWEGEKTGESLSRSSPGNPPTLTHILSRNLPLPKYFSSPPSFALYRLPRKNPHAFQQAIGTAAGKAGVTSLRIDPNHEDEELSERFVVGWIDVEVEDDGSRGESRPNPAPFEDKRTATGGIGMGTREDRRSFGSEETSRTVTPTPARDTPTPSVSRRSSSISTNARPGTRDRAVSTTSKSSRARVSTGETIKSVRRERQLIAITYSGDWYRLKIPDSNAVGSGDEEEGEEYAAKKGRCQLVEYRRLGVGGGGW